MNKTIKSFFAASVGTMVLTLIHHAYGAFIYDEPFRLHVTLIAVPVILVLYLTFRFYQKHRETKKGKILYRLFITMAIVFPIGVIGLYEGGYNHLVKNILYFGGISPELFAQLFPPPMYEMPNNFLFETTGIAQFVMGVSGLYFLLKMRIKNTAVPKVQV
ncbi:MAG: hypothetical protein WEA56_01315 [Balneolaceae bacterium]